MDTAAFATIEMRNLFEEFGRWLEGEVGAHKAALTVHRYLSFFTAFEARWKRIPTYPELLDRFGAEGLRRVQLPMRWLREACGVDRDSEAREADSERRRIQALSGALPSGSRAANVFADYRKELMLKLDAGRTSLRSVRLALRPAASLLLAADPEGRVLPDQSVLDRYLLVVPGQRASATGFVRYLSAVGALKLAVRVDHKKVRQVRRRALERELMRMWRHPKEGETFERRWITIGIAYFHNTKISKRDLAKAIVIRRDNGLWVDAGGERYFLPKPEMANS